MTDDYLIKIPELLKQYRIDASFVIGGSYSYRYNELTSLKDLRDIDILFITKSNDLISYFSKNSLDDISNIFQIEETRDSFSGQDIQLLRDKIVDGVRYSGKNNYGQKISIKFIAYDYLKKIYSQAIPGKINVLSKKDKRYYEKKAFNGSTTSIGVVNQKTSTDLTILGDPDIFSLKDGYSLGVISDLLLTGKSVISDPTVDELKKILANKIRTLIKSDPKNTPKSWSDIFIRSDRFNSDFINQLSLLFDHKADKENQNQNTDKQGISIYNVSPIILKEHKKFEISSVHNFNIQEYRHVSTSGPFSSNSTYGVAVTDKGDNIFYKKMLNEYRFRGEIYGLCSVSGYYPHLQTPIFIDAKNNILGYKWYNGDISSRKRLEGKIDNNQILETELRKSEDFLNAYIASSLDISELNVNENDIYNSRIHDLFFGRLIGTRFDEFYRDFSINIDRKSYKLFDIFDKKIVINGNNHGSIMDIFDQAKRYLDPKALSTKQKACGLGDSHSGNIMISEENDQYLYIDYEFAGFHSPYLDIAKPIYNDCLFVPFYSDLIPKFEYNVEVKILGDELHINHDFLLDRLSSDLLKIKIEGVIIPMRKFLNTKRIAIDSDWEKTLGYALFCCGLLTRNPMIFGDERKFILNLSCAVQISNFAQFYKDNTAR